MGQKPLVTCTIETRNPEKWVIVDTETGQVYNFDKRFASPKLLKKAKKTIKKIQKDGTKLY